MKEITFITGNQKKAEYLEKYLGIKVAHLKLDLDEIQSLDLNDKLTYKKIKPLEELKIFLETL